MIRRKSPPSTLFGLLACAILAFPAEVIAGEISPGSEPEESDAPTSRQPADVRSGPSEPEVFTVSKTRVIRAPRPDRSPVTAAGSALRAVVDPATGELISPPALEGRAPRAFDPRMERALSTSHYGLHPVHLPDGTVMVDLQGRFMSVLKARLGPDGTVSIHHAAAPGRCREPAPTPGGPQTPGEEDR